jgi:nickel/cobalt exporter
MSIYTIVICTRGNKAQRLSGTKEGGGTLFMRGVEFGAAGLVLLFGAGLLFGYLAAERVTCF